MTIQWLGGLTERLFGVAAAVAFSQCPLFIQQYLHQLSGHIAELQHQMDALQIVAGKTGKSVELFIQKFLMSSELEFRLQGQLLQNMHQRYHDFYDVLQTMQTAPAWERPLVFIRHVDKDVARDTWKAFEVGLPLTTEGGVYALIGIAIGCLLYKVLAILLRGLTVSLRKSLSSSRRPNKS